MMPDMRTLLGERSTTHKPGGFPIKIVSLIFILQPHEHTGHTINTELGVVLRRQYPLVRFIAYGSTEASILEE